MVTFGSRSCPICSSPFVESPLTTHAPAVADFPAWLYWHLSPNRHLPAANALHGIWARLSAISFFSPSVSGGRLPSFPSCANLQLDPRLHVPLSHPLHWDFLTLTGMALRRVGASSTRCSGSACAGIETPLFLANPDCLDFFAFTTSSRLASHKSRLTTSSRA